MPASPTPAAVAEFTTLVHNMTEILENNWYQSANPPEIMFICLVLVYEAIIKSETPAPALAAVLQLVPVSAILPATRALVTANGTTAVGLQITLYTLCEWLRVWPKATHLSQWIKSLIEVLCNNGMSDVVCQVASGVVERLLSILTLPFLRPGVLASLEVLFKFADHAIVKVCEVEKIPSIVHQLRRENSPSSAECIQWLMGVKQRGVEFRIPGKVGLSNLGNTCYMNSVIQALFMTPQFCMDVLSEVSGPSRPVLGHLQELFALLQHSRRPALAPVSFHSVARPTHFHAGDQQDSAEFLIHLLDQLHEEENSLVDVQQSSTGLQMDCSTPRQRSKSFPELDSDHKNSDQRRGYLPLRSHSGNDIASFPVPTKRSRSLSKYNSITQKSFGGKVDTIFICHSCFSRSVNTDPFDDLQLSFPISIDENVKIQHLVDFYFKSELLCGENRYKCDKCGCLCEAQRTLKVVEPPANLIVTVKHFSSNPATKLLRDLQYTECIVLPGCPEYYLYAAIVHSGYTMHGGHYVTFAKDISLHWHVYDDEIVTPTLLQELTKFSPPKTPYVLFYSQSRPPPLLESVLPIAQLQPHLQDIVNRDNDEYTQGQRDEEERRRRRKAHAIFSDDRRDDKDDNNPPSSCGGGRGNGMPPVRYTY